MSAKGDTAASKPGGASSPAALRSLHEERAHAELAAADRLAPGSDAVPYRGDVLADVMVVKGLSGPAEAAGGHAVSGADGDAALKAIEALGHDPARVFFTLSCPEPGIDPDRRAQRLRMQIEAVDARYVLGLDAEAAEDLSAATGVRVKMGEPVRILGRTIAAVDGLEASLVDEGRKKRVWRQLHAVKAAGPLY